MGGGQRTGNGFPGAARGPPRRGAGKPKVVARGFDVDYRVEGLIGEGQVLGVAAHEIQAGHLVLFSAEVDAGAV